MTARKGNRFGERRLLLLGVLALVGVAGAAALLWRGGDDQSPSAAPATGASTGPDPVHVHGLGINPVDGALFVATHTGLFRIGPDERVAIRVGRSRQDTMGFTVAGADRFLGSGHPDPVTAVERDLPPHLGLIESRDAGASWTNVALDGEADFHVLRVGGDRVYGYDASNDRLLASADGGRDWSELAKPGPLVDLAADPIDAQRLVAVSAGALEQGVFESRDGGGSWRRVAEPLGLLAWPERERLYLVDGGGAVLVSRDGGRSFERRGELGGPPAALLAAGANELYVALHDGSIEHSRDGGRTWSLRAAMN